MEKDREKKCNKYDNFKQESDKKTILKIFISKSYNEIHSYSKKKVQTSVCLAMIYQIHKHLKNVQ